MTCRLDKKNLKPFICDINCDKARAILNDHKGNDQFHIIDTRSVGMYKVGHLENAILLDAFKANFKSLLEHLDKDHIYLVYCTAGIRSLKAISVMQKSGFKYIYHLVNGLEGCEF